MSQSRQACKPGAVSSPVTPLTAAAVEARPEAETAAGCAAEEEAEVEDDASASRLADDSAPASGGSWSAAAAVTESGPGS